MMWDPETGGGYDGLHATWPIKTGAESTGAGINPSAGFRAPNYLYMKKTPSCHAPMSTSSRLVTRVALLFVAGQELGGAESRASSFVKRIVRSPRRRASASQRDHPTIRPTTPRHRRHLQSTRERVSNRLDPKEDLSEERWLLLGASFTHEYSLEAAAVCNRASSSTPISRTYRKAPCDS